MTSEGPNVPIWVSLDDPILAERVGKSVERGGEERKEEYLILDLHVTVRGVRPAGEGGCHCVAFMAAEA